ncbi:MAG: P1 family peptidase [Dehalococcoidia bacterium]|nr:putative aminopeptidase [Chloroflexota bacterium]MBT9160381.1 putative aminopeptidase [Chloroflexota bacterium]MBT9161928.1 putative aminopeptidase [Chloroflexota bacterium]
MHNAITDISGIKVGHYTDRQAATGCSVILCQAGAVAGVDVRGSAAGTRETDLLNPLHLVEEAHAVLISGGSAFGLDAAGGVMRYLEEQGCGYDTGVARVPIVPSAILFDLSIGDPGVRPGIEEGYKACLAADSGKLLEGTVGAGTGARVGKALGSDRAVKSGIGTASQQFGDGIIVGAIVAINAFGDVVDSETGRIIAGPRRLDGSGFLNTSEILKSGSGVRAFLPTSTTIGVVATNARLSKTQATKVAQMTHDGLARVIRPVHTMFDGDVIFVLSVGKDSRKLADVTTVGTVAAEVMAQSIIRGITQADGLCGIPSVNEVLRC